MRALSLLLLAVLAITCQGKEVCLDSLGRRGTPEGVWQTSTGAIFRIDPRPGMTGMYDLTLLLSPDLSVKSGTHFGTMLAGADRYTFDALLAADPKASHKAGKGHKRSFRITFDPAFSSLSLEHYRTGVSFNLMRLVPYLFRVGIERHREAPHDIAGAHRCDGTAIDYPVSL